MDQPAPGCKGKNMEESMFSCKMVPFSHETLHMHKEIALQQSLTWKTL